MALNLALQTLQSAAAKALKGLSLALLLSRFRSIRSCLFETDGRCEFVAIETSALMELPEVID
jgi:hypothetical protein